MKPVDVNGVLDFQKDFKNSEHYEPYVYHESGDSVQCSHQCCDILSDNYSFGIYLKSSNRYARVHKLSKFTNRGMILSHPTAAQEYLVGLYNSYTLPFFETYKINDYAFLPKFLFKTDQHMVFEWFHDYCLPTIDDFVDSKISLRQSFNLPVDEFIMSDFFKSIVSQFKSFYDGETISIDPPSDTFVSRSENDHICLTVDQMQLDDFVVMKDGSGNITDWKYTRVTSIEAGVPSYAFIADDNGCDCELVWDRYGGVCTSTPLLRLPAMFDNHHQLTDIISAVIMRMNGRWYKCSSVEDIDK